MKLLERLAAWRQGRKDDRAAIAAATAERRRADDEPRTSMSETVERGSGTFPQP